MKQVSKMPYSDVQEPGGGISSASLGPLIPVIGLNLFSLVLFLTSPIDFGSENDYLLALLVLVTQLAIYFGFRIGRARGATQLQFLEQRLSSRKFFTLCLIAYGVTLPFNYAYLSKTALFDADDLFGFFQYAWTDSHLGRRIMLDPEVRRTMPWRFYFLAALVNKFFPAVGFLLYRGLSPLQKAAFVALVGLEVLFWTAAGTNFGIISIVTTFLFAYFAATSASSRRLLAKARTIIVTAFLGVGAVFVFLYNLYTRSGKSLRDDTAFSIDQFGVNIRSDSIVFQMVPEVLLTPYMYVLSYLTQGYHHTSLAMDLDFVWTWMFGSIPALRDFSPDADGVIFERTYMFRLGALGIDPTGVWHSSYTWFANDFTFFGVPFVVAFMSYLFGFAWSRSISGDFLSKLVFVVMGNSLFFLWANNTYLSTVFYPLMFLLPYWLVTRVFLGKERRLVLSQ
jgi:hypothetical protein